MLTEASIPLVFHSLFSETERCISLSEFFACCILYTIVGVLIHEIARRLPRILIFFYIFFPIFFFTRWIHEPTDWFILGKVYLVCVLAAWSLYLRISKIQKKKWPYFLCYLLIFANIVEPASRLILSGTISGAFNAASCLLLLTIIPLPKAFSIDSKHPHDMLWDGSYSLIFSYLAWQVIFVYSNFPEMISQQIFLLLPCFFISLYSRKLFLQARIHTLSTFLMIGLTFPFFRNQTYPLPQNEELRLAFSVLLAVWMLGYFLYLRLFTKKI